MKPLNIVLDHRDFLVLDKPTGVAMHDSEKGITALLRKQFLSSDWYLCHRLDTDTSGCLCVAKTKQAASEISQQFATGETEKMYLALSTSKPKKKQGTISGDMINRRSGQYVLKRSQDNPAVTQFFSFGIADGLRGFVVKPLTGKTHQIRVALRSLGSPILGDKRYSGDTADRMYLHAWSLSFKYQGEEFNTRTPPATGEYFLREDVQKWLETLTSSESSMKWPVYKRPKQSNIRI